MEPPRTPSSRRAALAASLLAVGALLPGCGPPGRTGDPAAAYVYVAGSAAGTVARLERQTGRPVGRPLPAGPAPAQLEAGPDGSLLALATWPMAPREEERLTHVVPAAGGGRARPVDLGAVAHGALLAGDGGRQALV